MTLAQKEKIGKNMIWLGFLAWVPYIYLQIIEIEAKLLPFLLVHLVGVIGGGVLRHQADPDAGPLSQRQRLLKTGSTILLALGITVWAIYFGMEWITGVEREITPWLITHLSMMLPGAGIKMYTFLSRG